MSGIRKSKTRLSIVSPIYNNKETFPIQLERLLGILESTIDEYEVVLIDDASSDGSQVVLQKMASKYPNVRITFHSENHGIASTYKELYQTARYSPIVLFSFDGEWNEKDILRLFNASQEFDVVIGKRKKKAYGFGRAAISYFYNAGTKFLFGMDIYDAGSIKLLPKSVIEIPIFSKSVFDEAERVLKAKMVGFRVGAIDIDHYANNKASGFLQKSPLMLAAFTDMVRVFIDLRILRYLPTPTAPTTTSTPRRTTRET